jgi:MFS family permease
VETSEPLKTAPGNIWRNRDFRVVLFGQAVSTLGDAVSFTALPLLVLLLTGSGLAMAAVGVLQTLPDLIFGLPAGALADRWDRRKMMLSADLGRAALTALIPLSVMTGGAGLNTMTVILIVTAPINLLRVVFLAAFNSAMPNLVGRDQVAKGNGYVEAAIGLSFIIGPAVAGILIGIIGPGPTLAVDAVSFFVSGLTLMIVRRPLREAGGRTDQHLLVEIAEGLRYIAHEPTLRMVITFWGTVSVLTAPLIPAVIFFLSVDRHQSTEIVGVVLSAFGAGYLLGAIILGQFAKSRLGVLMILGADSQAVVIIAFALVGTPEIWVALAFLHGLFGAVVFIPYITLRSTIPPDQLLGRVGSSARTISVGLAPIGLFIGGVLLDTIGGSSTLLFVGVAGLLASLGGTLSSSLRRATQVSSRAPRSADV